MFAVMRGRGRLGEFQEWLTSQNPAHRIIAGEIEGGRVEGRTRAVPLSGRSVRKGSAGKKD